MMKRVFTLFVLCCTCLGFAGSALSGSLSWVSHDRWVTVKRVVDGDTFVTRKGEKIRLLGINTPEIRHNTSPAEPYGKQASKILRNFILGKQVRLGFDKERKDRYGRTLAHVYLRDGIWLNEEMLRLGSAFVYTFPPNTAKASAMVEIEQRAVRSNLGIWKMLRWQVLTPGELKTKLLGQFRLVNGKVTAKGKSGWRFSMGKLRVTIPRKYRSSYGRAKQMKIGDKVLVRGRLRMSKKGQWFLSVHTTSDVLHLN